jgi:hypothetical protein
MASEGIDALVIANVPYGTASEQYGCGCGYDDNIDWVGRPVRSSDDDTPFRIPNSLERTYTTPSLHVHPPRNSAACCLAG